jgi:fatty-acyl-CoA synthase
MMEFSDVGLLNSDNSLAIVGRKKDMIIRGGENIYPQEIENLIATHPHVKDVQVVGIPDERLGEEVCAVIQLNDGCEIQETELRSFCQGKISHFKIPRYVLFRPHTYFPRTLSGKIKKNLLAEKCYAELCGSEEKLMAAEG